MASVLEKELRRITSPITLLFPDDSKMDLENGRELGRQAFDKKYGITEIRNQDERIEIVLQEISMEKDRSLNKEWVFKQGCAFADCAQALEIEGRTKLDMILPTHTHAAISLSAFACELFLKCLLIYSGFGFDNIHKLEDLWNDYKLIAEPEANQIEESIEAYFSNSNGPVFYRMLKEASNAFSDWRYSYEGKTLKINRNFIIAFRKVLKEACCVKLYGMQWNDYVQSQGDV